MPDSQHVIGQEACQALSSCSAKTGPPFLPRLQKIGTTEHFPCQRGNDSRQKERFPCRAGSKHADPVQSAVCVSSWFGERVLIGTG